MVTDVVCAAKKGVCERGRRGDADCDAAFARCMQHAQRYDEREHAQQQQQQQQQQQPSNPESAPEAQPGVTSSEPEPPPVTSLPPGMLPPGDNTVSSPPMTSWPNAAAMAGEQTSTEAGPGFFACSCAAHVY